MEWTQDDTKRLLLFKNCVDSDNIKVKEKIKEKLIDNKYIIHVLNNKELELVECEPDEYYNVNILPYYIITPTQTKVENFICYSVNYKELAKYNKVVKSLQIVFVVLCNQGDLIDKETGIARHDLLAALIQDQFNYTNYFGSKIELVSDLESVVDNSYSCRTLTFEQITDNNVVKTKVNDGSLISKISNKDIVV